MLHHSSIADGQRIRQCGPRDCSSGDDDDDDDADADDAMQRGIDLIFIISLTFRRGKLGLVCRVVCASLMLPITSSLLKYLNGSRTGGRGRGRTPGRDATHTYHYPLPTARIKAYRARDMRHGR